MTEPMTSFTILQDTFRIVLMVVGFKAMMVGSEFNFWYWLKYGKRYTQWLRDRPEFKDTL